MLRATRPDAFRGGHKRSYILKDSTLVFAQRTGTMKVGAGLRAGWLGHTMPRQPTGKEFGQDAIHNDHAFPVLNATDYGYQEQSMDTKYLELGSSLPKRAKGLPPWWRGADTYAQAYTEQGRYEYQRYQMVSRTPFEYARGLSQRLEQLERLRVRDNFGRFFYDKAIPQEALHVIYRMLVDNWPAQHIHYLTAMEVLMMHEEWDMARDVWKIMERQQVWPTDKLIVCFLELCALAGEKTWALECWNRYCNEKRFLQEGEPDPKPISRVPFALNRDETMFLPKWKKHFEHDPNLDVNDLNRFNTTRDIYRAMSVVMLVTGEEDLFHEFFGTLETSLLTTPTPVPEPHHNPKMGAKAWDPLTDVNHLVSDPWTTPISALGPTRTATAAAALSKRFDSNAAFLCRSAADCIDAITKLGPNRIGKGPRRESLLPRCERIFDRVVAKLGAQLANVDTVPLFMSLLRARRVLGAEGTVTGERALKDAKSLLALKARAAAAAEAEAEGRPAPSSATSPTTTEPMHEALVLEVLRAFEDQSSDMAKRPFDPRKVMNACSAAIRELTARPSFVWALDMHHSVIRTLVNCGTMKANDYFVKNVLRAFDWRDDILIDLYKEYSRADTVEQWAELTKRALIWHARYNASRGHPLSEEFREVVEADYDQIKVQVRTLRDVAAEAYRATAERKLAKNPASTLPNPVADYVSHALPFPDRDTGTPNQYGDIGQWRQPEKFGNDIKGPPEHAPPMPAEQAKGFMATWREQEAVQKPLKLPGPWDRKYVEYNRGKHPSYDGTYAGEFMQVFPSQKNFRQPTRWDMQDINRQSKYIQHGPY